MTKYYPSVADGLELQVEQQYTFAVEPGKAYPVNTDRNPLTVSAISDPGGGFIEAQTGAVHNLNVGDKFQIYGSSVTAYNGSFTVTAIPTTTSVQWTGVFTTTPTGSIFLRSFGLSFLPPNPTPVVGDRFQVFDARNNATKIPVTLNPVGNTFNGVLNPNIVLDRSGFNALFTYVGGTVGWSIDYGTSEKLRLFKVQNLGASVAFTGNAFTRYEKMNAVATVTLPLVSVTGSYIEFGDISGAWGTVTPTTVVLQAGDTLAPGSSLTMDVQYGIYRFTYNATTFQWTSSLIDSFVDTVVVGATASVVGKQGDLPAPAIGQQDASIYGDGLWDNKDKLSIVTKPDYALSGSLGTAVTTVDVGALVQIAQTTANVALTLPAPTVQTKASRLTVANTGTATVSVGGLLVAPGSYQQYLWSTVALAWEVPSSTLTRVSTAQVNLYPGSYDLDSSIAAFSISLPDVVGTWYFHNTNRSLAVNAVTLLSAGGKTYTNAVGAQSATDFILNFPKEVKILHTELGTAYRVTVDDTVVAPNTFTPNGAWDAATNTPDLTIAGNRVSGSLYYVYYVSTSGTQNLGSGSTAFAAGGRIEWFSPLVYNYVAPGGATAMVGATNLVAGAAGIVPAPAIGAQDAPLVGDATYSLTDRIPSISLPDLAVSGLLGLASATVDIAGAVQLTQNTASIAFTLPAPTVTTSVRRFTVFNTGTVPFMCNGSSVPVGNFVEYVWSTVSLSWGTVVPATAAAATASTSIVPWYIPVGNTFTIPQYAVVEAAVRCLNDGMIVNDGGLLISTPV